MTTEHGGLAVLAVDDELPALDELVFLLQADERVASVDVAHDATGALHMLRDRTYDLLMLDIRMPHLDGLELARLMLRFSEPPSVVFVTAHDGHAVEAFEVRASDYLLKPPSADRLAEALERVCLARSQARTPPDDLHIVPVDNGGTTRLIDRSDIAWVEAQGDYVRLHVVGGTNHLIRLPISTLAERWADAGFVRIHRGYLVAIRHISEISSEAGTSIVRVGGTELPVSRRHTRELRDRLVRAARRGGLR
ncbi:MAG TPA: LytTR family DNA-binding domain-containing protein [Mycobacteriales bacterium]|nr:LytTR family DNA-binding domain-containing protein [Mycobacteriales bacterium]